MGPWRWLPALLAAGVCAWHSPEPPKPPKPLKHGPVAYFRDHCQRCHGAFGAAYEDDFTKGKTLQQMTDVIKSMAAGQGGSPLTDENELQAQIAFHYAIDLKKPFLSWTGLDGRALSGEVTPDAKLKAQLSGADFPVTAADGVWRLTLPSGEDPGKVVLTATIKDAKSTLDLSKTAFSSATAKPQS